VGGGGEGGGGGGGGRGTIVIDIRHSDTRRDAEDQRRAAFPVPRFVFDFFFFFCWRPRQLQVRPDQVVDLDVGEETWSD